MPLLQSIGGGRQLKECCLTGYTRPRELKTQGKAGFWERRHNGAHWVTQPSEAPTTASVRGFVEGAFLVRPYVRTRDKPSLKGRFYGPKEPMAESNNNHCAQNQTFGVLLGTRTWYMSRRLRLWGPLGREFHLNKLPVINVRRLLIRRSRLDW